MKNDKLFNLLVLAFLIILLIIAGTVIIARVELEREIEQLRIEKLLLEAENAYLREKLTELRKKQTELYQRLEEWLNTWEMLEMDATFYSPFDDRNGLNSDGNPNVTALGSLPGPGKFAVDFKVIPPHSLMWVEGEGWGIAADTGGAIQGNRIDIYRDSYDVAMMEGVKKLKVIYQKRKE